MRRFVSAWVPVIAWMLVIFSASTDLGSAAQTSRILVPFLHWLNPQITLETVMQVQFLVRKAGHLTEYAIFAVLLWRALRMYIGGGWSQAALALGFAAAYAATDEFHQSFVATRTPSLGDVAIDCCGAALGLLLYGMMAARSRAGQERAAMAK